MRTDAFEGADAPIHLEIVVPAYNEARRLPLGLALLSEKLRDLAISVAVLVVDNGSTDATPEIVRSWTGPVPVRLLQAPERGKGAAVRAGLLATRAPYVGFCDADMATDLGVLEPVLRLLGNGHEVVVGSRRHPESQVEGYSHPLRRLGAITFNRLIRDLAGGVPDTQCGFKFFAGPLARAAAADLRTTGFSFDVELLMHCARRGAAITDVPVVWQDVPGTTFSVGRHSVSCLLDLARIRARARRSARAGHAAQFGQSAHSAGAAHATHSARAGMPTVAGATAAAPMSSPFLLTEPPGAGSG